jgi:hypothetical protein
MAARQQSPAVAAEMAAPAIGIRIGVPGEDGRMIELTAYADRDEPVNNLNAILDKMRVAADRQRAIGQLPALRHELDGHRKIYEENRKALAAETAKLEETGKLYNERRAELIAKRDSALNTARDEHYASGRGSEYKPAGHVAGLAKRIESELHSIDGLETKATNENAAACSQIQAMIDKSRQSIDILERRVQECEKLANGEDISGLTG